VLCSASFLALILAYSNHFYNSFHFDDSHTIVDNVFIRDMGNIPLFFRDARTTSSLPANQGYRPMTNVTLAIDYWLGNGLASTFYFHLSTFLWYMVQCILMYLLYLKIMNTAVQHEWNRYIALFAVGWYALHAANAETINYIIQRADSLSTLMVVAGFVLYAYLPGWRRRYIYLIPIVIGVLFKEPAVMFAPILFFYIMFFEKDYSLPESLRPGNISRNAKDFLPAFIVCAGMGIFVIEMMSSSFTPGGTSRFSYLITQPFVMVHYLIQFFLPFQLSADSDWKVVRNIFDEKVISAVVFILAMLYIAHITSKKRETRPISFGIIWFFLALVPTSSIIPLAEVTNDHRMFFPFIGLMLSVCWAAGVFVIRHEKNIRKNFFAKTGVILIAVGILCGHAYGTHERNKVWHTEESLWHDVTLKSPENGRGLMNYGLSQMSKGNYQKAQEYFERALVLTPHYSVLHVNMGILKGAMNQPAEAEKYFRSALQYGPDNPASYFFYAKWLNSRNRSDEAVPLLKKAVQLSPAYDLAQNLLNEILRGQRNINSPLENAEETVKNNPTSENYLSLSLKYYNAGRFKDSINACRNALKIKPDYYLAYNNICAAYNELRMWDKAIDSCKK